MTDAGRIVEMLGLAPLPGEGGWYAETWRSACEVPASALPAGYPAARAAGTAIYYLLAAGTGSRLHRVPGDEVWHFYAGDPVELLVLPSGEPGGLTILGTDLAAGQRPQAVVPGGAWQGARLSAGGRWALMGTTMAPGFDFADWEAGDAEALAAAWPAHAALVRSL